jgi:pilus assembly protein Flp/PilA
MAGSANFKRRRLSLKQILRSLWREEAGQDLIEYALVTAMIGLMSAAALSPVAKAVGNGVDQVEKKFREHTNHGHEHENSGQHKGWYK